MRTSIEWKKPVAMLLVLASLFGGATSALAQACEEAAPPPAPPNTSSLPAPAPDTV